MKRVSKFVASPYDMSRPIIEALENNLKILRHEYPSSLIQFKHKPSSASTEKVKLFQGTISAHCYEGEDTVLFATVRSCIDGIKPSSRDITTERMVCNVLRSNDSELLNQISFDVKNKYGLPFVTLKVSSNATVTVTCLEFILSNIARASESNQCGRICRRHEVI